MTDPDRTPGTEPETPGTAPADEEGRDPTEGPTSEQNRTAAGAAKAEGEDDPPD
ncbi:hypothetical protein [Kitasatospora phosalacinea]|uniref:hypothetical protein n=1 Tax=Kitasatospora phosalacinea TaxID=2065 RepID=UPI000A5A3668|nr:hypothetical protein [Kitasatospora phosalacinea]